MLAVSDFVDRAGMPTLWKERDLQIYLMDCLKGQGFQVRDEVSSNGGRADIVSDYLEGCIIEVKKYLDRDTIYQAAGQLHLYGLGNARKLVIMGFLTTDHKKQDSALTTASMIKQDPRYSVIFINMDSEWYPGASAKRKSWFGQFRLPELSYSFDWLKNPPPTHKAIFNIFQLVIKVATAHPLPTFLVAVTLFAIATNPPQKETPSTQKVERSQTVKKLKVF
jgi:hypothetical protein